MIYFSLQFVMIDSYIYFLEEFPSMSHIKSNFWTNADMGIGRLGAPAVVMFSSLCIVFTNTCH